MIFFAWVDKDTAFDPDLHSVEDEVIYSVAIEQAEGDFATLTMEIDNPGVGLLSPGRQQWAWLSEDGAPLFYGRVDAAADDIISEVIQVVLIAEPEDIAALKEALAATLRVLPYYDKAWIQQDAENPDIVLETRTAHFDVDRTTHALSIVDFTNPGGVDYEITESEHFYDAMKTAKTGVPLKRGRIKATAKWRQKAQGTVDLTEKLYKAALASGSVFNYPAIGSFTSAGMVEDWPEPFKSLNGGWEMAADSYAYIEPGLPSGFYPVTYIDKSDETIVNDAGNAAVVTDAGGTPTFGITVDVPNQSQYGNPLQSPTTLFNANWVEYQISFPIVPITQKFTIAYDADRERTETIDISLSADVQSLYFDAGAEEEELIELSSDFIDQPVDDDEALPIVDVRRNNYFPTDRGQLSVQYFLLLLRARLLWRARAYTVEFEAPWELFATTISCRRRVLLHDGRLPGGQALGKIIGYSLLADDRRRLARVTIACAIGTGIALPAASNDGDDYAEDYADDYTELINLTIDVITGELQYSGFDGTIVVDDDGVDFFNMTPDRVLLEPITIINGQNEQKTLIDASISGGVIDPDPAGVLRDHPTRPRVRLKQVTGGAFLTEYVVTVSPLVIPKMIDLEAA